MDLNGGDWTNLGLFDVEETVELVKTELSDEGLYLLDIMCRHMYTGIEQHRVGHLSMKPLRFVQWEKLNLWSDKS